MSQELFARNNDLAKLVAEGFTMEECSGYLIVHHIPYLDAQKIVKDGKLVMQLDLAGDKTSRPNSHVSYWAGMIPCRMDGTPLHSVINNDLGLGDYHGSVHVDYGCSCKREDQKPYADYYEKVTTYFHIISDPALRVDSDAFTRINHPVEITPENSPFMYIDTNSSRANITALSELMEKQDIAIVGLGGTGSYLLDFLTKTPVNSIHLYDDDKFLNHNAFRAPGAAGIDELEKFPLKVEYFAGIYAHMHRNIIPHPYSVTEDKLGELLDYDFVFLCVDGKDIRDMIGAFLIVNNRPFIDSGIGASAKGDKLSAMLRITTGFMGHYDHIKQAFDEAGDEKDEYKTNIQISELNALSAVWMIIKWKQLVGFYADYEKALNHYISIDSSQSILKKYE
jgi:hypothetical protein